MAYDWKRVEQLDRLNDSRTLRIMGWTDLALVPVGILIMLITHSTKMLPAVIFTAILGFAYVGIAASGRRDTSKQAGRG